MVRIVFLPTWGIGHLISAVETAKRLLRSADNQFSITFLIMCEPILGSAAAAAAAYIQSVAASYIQSVAASGLDIHFQYLPSVDSPPLHETDGPEDFVSLYVQAHRPHVKAALSRSAPPVSALVLDFFATTMIDVAVELGIPAYLYFTSGAAMLALMLHLPTLHEKLPIEFEEMEGAVEIPGLSPIPPLSMPSPVMRKKNRCYTWFVYHGRRFQDFTGIIVNTFADLEHGPLAAIADGRCTPGRPTPPVYPVGPVLNLGGGDAGAAGQHECIAWLDGQPAGSVVLLSFGSMGSFDAVQVREVAAGLERSGHRFLWCLRVRPPADARALPEGFLAKTQGRGMVRPSWVPQAEILAHRAVGGFVTHCGWNSCLESVWFGVPMLGWPLHAEQHLNAFVMARDMGVALELAVDRMSGGFVGAEEVERGVRCLMEDCEDGNRVRAKAAEMRAACRKATAAHGGSSFLHLERLAKELCNSKSSHPPVRVTTVDFG